MAYLDRDLFEAGGTSPTPRIDRAESAARSSLSAIERQVVMLSLGDPRSSLAGQSAWRRRLDALLGLRRPNRLADPRLEALRRLAVLMRLDGFATDASEYEAFTAAGFRPGAAEEVYSFVTPHRAPVSRRTSRLAERLV